MTTRVVLGSASSGRLRVLRQAGVDPVVVVSGVDEDAVITRLGGAADPADVVMALAKAKAEAVCAVVVGTADGNDAAHNDDTARNNDGVAADCVVLGCDSMLFFDGQLRGKPGTAEQAVKQWKAMAGRVGQLFTGHYVIRVRDAVVVDVAGTAAVTGVRFGVPGDADVNAYVASGEPLEVAGGFTLDGLGGWFVDGVQGDPSNVVGVSLPVLRQLLNSVGVAINDVWIANPIRG